MGKGGKRKGGTGREKGRRRVKGRKEGEEVGERGRWEAVGLKMEKGSSRKGSGAGRAERRKGEGGGK